MTECVYRTLTDNLISTSTDNFQNQINRVQYFVQILPCISYTSAIQSKHDVLRHLDNIRVTYFWLCLSVSVRHSMTNPTLLSFICLHWLSCLFIFWNLFIKISFKCPIGHCNDNTLWLYIVAIKSRSMWPKKYPSPYICDNGGFGENRDILCLLLTIYCFYCLMYNTARGIQKAWT